jgi:PAS domain S-box-containing protein
MVWMLTYAFELASVGLAAKLFWNKAQYFGSAGLPALFLVYVLQYTGHDRYVTRRAMVGLSVVPVATVLLAVTNESHRLIWRRLHLDAVGAYTVLINEHGAGFWVFVAYAYVVVLAGLALLGLRFVRSRGFYRWQTGGLFVGATFPVVGSVLYVSGPNPAPHLNLPVIAFAATSLTVGWSVFRHHLFSVTPIARDAVIEEIDAAVLVIDDQDRIVDANDAARELVGRAGNVVGEPIEAVWPEHADLLAEDRSRTFHEEIVADSPDGRRYYDLRVTPLSNRDGQQVGRLLVVRDVTDRERREPELERKNEQLEEFAGVLSHDLRNPLSVARGYLELAAEDGDEAAFRHVEQAHDRIERIIGDMLTLARQGQTVSETEPVELADVAADAWANAATSDADLTVAESHTLEADETRLLQLFENLFSNAVQHGAASPPSRPTAMREGAGEHGSTSPRSPLETPEGDAKERADGEVAVRVGTTADGFYVADDSPGIPEKDREDVFAYGHSSRQDGTGLGLSIVKNVAEAHGWEVDVGESWAGGARFEVTLQ